jgi:hypothetical protein
MSDDDSTPSVPTDEPSFDDPAHAELRALLRGARVTEPIPADVAARLDATLASLQAERRAEDEPAATVLPLRRRGIARVLVAAAAAVVIGAGGIAISQGGLNDAGSDDSAATADSGAGSDTGSLREGPMDPGSEADKDAPLPAATARGLLELNGTLVPVFTSARFAQEAQAYDPATGGFTELDSLQKRYSIPSPADALTDDATTDPPDDGATSVPLCVGPQLPDTETLPMLLDGNPTVLVLHPVKDGAQVLEAWSCDGATRLTTATVTR